MENTIPKWVMGLFLLALLAGAYFRFTQPLDRVPTDDEAIVMVSAAKLNTTHPSYDPRYYNFEHPFLGKKILGEWISINAPKLTETAVIPVNLYTYNYLAAEELKEWEGSMRAVNAVFGLLLLIPVFLIARKWFGTRTGILSVIIFSLSIGFINLSRYLLQDGLLSFFYLSTIYLFMKYADSSTETWQGVPQKYIYLAATMGMWVATLLIRIQQPLLLGVGMIIALAWLKRPVRLFILISVIGLGIAALAYTPTALLEMIEIKGANAVSENSGVYAVNVLAGMISQNSVVALVTMILACAFVYARRKEGRTFVETFLRNPGQKPVVLIAMVVTLIPLLASFFTSMGSVPRYFLIVFSLPMIYLGNVAAQASTNAHKYLVAGAVFLDIALLFLVAPPFVGYSIAGMQPVFLIDNSPNQLNVIPALDSLHVQRFFTNDAGLILRNSRAAPLPPNMKGFAYYSLCNENFGQIFHKSIIVYRPGEPFYNSSFVCPFAQAAARPIPYDTIPALPPYEFYMVIDENQLSFSGT